MESSARRAVPGASRTLTAQPPALHARRASTARPLLVLLNAQTAKQASTPHLSSASAVLLARIQLAQLLYAPSAQSASTRRRRGSLPAPTASQARIPLALTRFSTKQGGVEEEEVVHVQCWRLHLCLLGEDLLP